MRKLKPLRIKASYYQPIERQIMLSLWHIIFKPLIVALEPYGVMEIKNARFGIVESIQKGKIIYVDGKFKGKFNALTTKQFLALGGKYDRRSKSWSLPTLPAEIQIAVAQSEDYSRRLVSALVRQLDNIHIPEKPAQEYLAKDFEKTIGMIDKDFDAAVASITVKPRMTERAKKAIAENWSNNLDLYIRKFSDKSIKSLREKVQVNAMAGLRAENIEKLIQEEYGVSRRKAKFLARQETGLLMSKYQQERYKDLGIDKYIWGGSEDERERPDHWALNNKVFSWSNPPITNRDTGARNHPGEDFNCRCVAIPLIK